jgi:hypothetical protein
MIILFNIFSLLLCAAWNLFIVVGSVYLIDDFHWSPWTLVVTLCLVDRWKPYKMAPEEKEEEEEPRIITSDTGNFK